MSPSETLDFARGTRMLVERVRRANREAMRRLEDARKSLAAAESERLTLESRIAEWIAKAEAAITPEPAEPDVLAALEAAEAAVGKAMAKLKKEGGKAK